MKIRELRFMLYNVAKEGNAVGKWNLNVRTHSAA
jgi:hypothetical protein